MHLVTDLQRLAQKHCSLSIQTIDNPGWMVTIKLPTPLTDKLRVEGDPPRPSNGNRGGRHWLVCKVERGAFTGAGDPSQLAEILRCFEEWGADLLD